MKIMTSHVVRYLEIWGQIQEIPIADRPLELRRELNDLWYDIMTVEDKVQVSTLLEARDQ